MRWFQRGNGPAGDAGQLDPIRIFTPEIELTGFVAPTGQRVTDMLLRGQDLAFLPDGAEIEPENWVSVSPADVLLVVPPPLPRGSDWASRQQSREVFVRIGDYRVAGSAHLEQPDQPPASLRARHPFLPLTAASITRPGSPEDERVDVAIVNLGRSSEFRSMG